jgi:two-component system phosphate regulon response regulator PhoB
VEIENGSKILIVEDEREIRELVSIILLRAGYTVQAVETAEQARESLKQEDFDLVILDWMLPHESGIDLLASLAKKSKSAPPLVILLTARAEPADIIWGLENGADDYVTKPFDTKVLVAKVEALLRRNGRSLKTEVAQRLDLDGLCVDRRTTEVHLNETKIDLTNTETRLLWTLLCHPEIVLTRDRILSLTQGVDVNVIGRTVDTHMFSLRKKLAPWSDRIVTVRGVGYRLVAKAIPR